MTRHVDLNRRRSLRMFAGMPFLPLAGGTLLLSACGGGEDSTAAATAPVAPAPLSSVSFEGMAAPGLALPAEMATTSVKSIAVATYSSGTVQRFALQYQPFFVTGDLVSDGKGGKILAGGYYDINNRPIVDASVAGKERQFFSDCPDGSSLLVLPSPAVSGVKGKTVFAVVQFEYVTRNQNQASMYGMLPSPIAVLTLDQDPATGALSLVKYSNVDTSGVNGLWITCGASLSPWGTHLSSEEYEPDAVLVQAAGTNATKTQFQAYSSNLYGSASAANPYHYGHLPEVTVQPDGTGTIVKHYCTGRISHELVQVMPDQRTVVMGDDATNGALFMFIADKAKDLSAGTLYVARWSLSSAAAGGQGSLKWIRLGHATSAEIKALADSLVASDIMTVATTDPADASFTKIAFNGGSQWVKFKAGRELAAAFLETHRWAAFKGASMAFTKLEGTTLNAKDKIAYFAMSDIKSDMKNYAGLDRAIRSGAVYAAQLAAGQTDTDGLAIDSAWVPATFGAVTELTGEDLASADALGNLSNPERIANPDNLKFSEKLRTLFIGEDSGRHVNNFLWAYNVDTKRLSRVLSVPAGAESTGLHAVDEINGWTYVMSNFQHAGDWESPLHDVVKPALDPLVRANYKDRFGAAVGYLTGLPLSA